MTSAVSPRTRPVITVSFPWFLSCQMCGVFFLQPADRTLFSCVFFLNMLYVLPWCVVCFYWCVVCSSLMCCVFFLDADFAHSSLLPQFFFCSFFLFHKKAIGRNSSICSSYAAVVPLGNRGCSYFELFFLLTFEKCSKCVRPWVFEKQGISKKT